MKIFDCFMYFDEDLVLDLRFNYLSKFVDNFVIVESKFNHKGEERKLEFDLNRFVKFKDKITYIILDKNPEGIEKIKDNDSEIEKNNKFINNSNKRERFQRDQILNGLVNAEGNDWVIISDVDEIPNLENINFGKLKKWVSIYDLIPNNFKSENFIIRVLEGILSFFSFGSNTLLYHGEPVVCTNSSIILKFGP